MIPGLPEGAVLETDEERELLAQQRAQQASAQIPGLPEGAVLETDPRLPPIPDQRAGPTPPSAPTAKERQALAQRRGIQRVRDENPGPVEQIAGIADAVGSFGVSAVLFTIGGLEALIETNVRNTAGFKDAEDFGVDALNRRMTQSSLPGLGRIGEGPSTELGKQIHDVVALATEPLMAAVDWTAVNLSFGNPYAATAIKTALVGLPIAKQITTTGRAVATRLNNRQLLTDKIKQVEAAAKEAGINLDPIAIEKSIVDQATRLDTEARGAAIESAVAELKVRKTTSRAKVDAAYEAARETPAYMQTSNMNAFTAGVTRELLELGWDIKRMPILQDRLGELGNLERKIPLTNEAIPPSLRVKGASLKSIDVIQRRINNTRPSDAPGTLGRSENAALNKLAKDLREFMDAEFNRDAISGSTEAVGKWKSARGAARTHIENFTEDKFIRQMIMEEATPEQYRAWLVGANAQSAKPIAGRTAKRLKEILGEDSPHIEAIRQDFLMDVAEPLFQETPNFKAFIRNYDRLIRKNPTLVDELGLDKTTLTDMRDFAVAANKVGVGKAFGMDLTTMAARFTFGHRIAKAAMKVQIAKLAMDRMFRVGKVGRKQIISEVIGIDVTKPLIPKGSVIAGGVIAAEAERVTRDDDTK